MNTPEIIQCKNCDCEIDHDSSYWHDDIGGDVCQECYYDHTTPCAFCDDRCEDSALSRFFLMLPEACAAVHGDYPTPPGIYTTEGGRGMPDMAVPLIGSPTIWRDGMRWVCASPIPLEECDLSGTLCLACTQKHHLNEKWGPIAQKEELPAIRRAFLRQPTLAQEMQIDDENRWQSERWRAWMQQLGLQKQRGKIRPWKPWTILDYQGVKLYSHLYNTHWREAITDPRPHWRNDRHTQAAREAGILVNPSCLPGWFPEMGDYDGIDDMARPRYLSIFRHAIRTGFLTQEGVASPFASQPDWYWIGRQTRLSAYKARWQVKYPQYHSKEVIDRLTNPAAALKFIIAAHRQRAEWDNRPMPKVDLSALRNGWNSTRPKLARLLQSQH